MSLMVLTPWSSEYVELYVSGLRQPQVREYAILVTLLVMSSKGRVRNQDVAGAETLLS